MAKLLKKMIVFFLSLQDSVKIYHWSTLSYGRHIATDGLYSSLDKLVDSFVETFIISYGGLPRVEQPIALQMDAKHMSCPKQFSSMLLSCSRVLSDGYINEAIKHNVALCSIRDEMVEAIGKCRYLIRMNK